MTTRVAVAGFQHETNTFAPFPTTHADFERPGAWPGLTRGFDIPRVFRDRNIPVAGFLAATRHEVVPVLWAMAEPGGTVRADAFERIADEIAAGVAAARPDAVYLDLHGAMVAEGHHDAEAELLRRVRDAVGPDVPVVASLDLHANVSPLLAARATALACYRTYPHVDMARTGARAAALLDAALAGPVHGAYRQAPFLVPITAQRTEAEPARGLYAALAADDALSVDMCLGFPPADIPDAGPAVVAYARDPEAAARAAEAAMARLMAAEHRFDAALVPAAEAVARALALPRGPVVIADVGDNPGAGGTGDTTGILRALLDARAPDAVLGLLHDPDAARAARAAGLGARIALRLGGRHGEHGAPVEAEVVVEALADGRFAMTGPYFAGSEAAMGPMAALRIAGTGVRVAVATERAQNADRSMFRAVGIDPAAHAVVVVKSAVHFLADYGPTAAAVLFAAAPGANPTDLTAVKYRRLRDGVRR